MEGSIIIKAKYLYPFKVPCVKENIKILIRYAYNGITRAIQTMMPVNDLSGKYNDGQKNSDFETHTYRYKLKVSKDFLIFALKIIAIDFFQKHFGYC